MLASMGVDIPEAAVNSILKAQGDWEKKCVERSTKEKLHKRNQQKKAKRVRHEKEKEFMEALGGLGNVVGKYVGDGQGEVVDSETQAVDMDIVGADSEVYDLSAEQNEASTDNADPLLFLYDCETTGLSIYNEHIVEIAAEVVNCDHSDATFSSLVKTSRRIPTAGTKLKITK